MVWIGWLFCCLLVIGATAMLFIIPALSGLGGGMKRDDIIAWWFVLAVDVTICYVVYANAPFFVTVN